MSDEPVYEVVWPSSPCGVQRRSPAPRLATLDGATVAFLWDDLFRGDELFPVLADELRRQFTNVGIIDYPVIGNIHGADEAEVVRGLPRRLHDLGVDAVVCGMGC